MRIATVKVVRKFNLGNYEMLELSAEVSPDEDTNDLNITGLCCAINKELEQSKKEILEKRL